MIRLQRAGLAACALLSCLYLAACNDYYRPTAVPLSPPAGDPQLQRQAFVVNYGTPGSPSTVTRVDATGDTITGINNAGKGAVHVAALPGGIGLYVANRDDDTITSMNALAPGGSTVTTVQLQDGCKPVYVATSEVTNVYVACSGTNAVDVISAAQNVLTNTITVGVNPVALAEIPDRSKVYAINKGDGTVSVINTRDQVVTAAIGVGVSPTWAVMNPAGTRLYVVNQGDGTVSVIDTGSDTVLSTLGVGSGPNFAFYDTHSLRLYVTNGASNSLSIFRADVDPPALLKEVDLHTPDFNGTKNPVSITALADGTRAYVANEAEGTVTVINTLNNTVSKTIPVGTSPVSIASSPESTRVVVANRDSNNISDIQTSNDSVIATIPSSSPSPMFVLIE
jgi:YVTN family beta-propeller protein